MTAPIECRRSAGPGRLTLIGETEQGRALLTLLADAPADLPARIEEGSVQSLDAQRYRVSMPGREWIVVSKRSFVHHDASAEFYAALPPRRVRLAKRLFWRCVLGAASSRAGRRWLAR